MTAAEQGVVLVTCAFFAFLLGYNFCRRTLRAITEAEAGKEMAMRIFGEVTHADSN